MMWDAGRGVCVLGVMLVLIGVLSGPLGVLAPTQRHPMAGRNIRPGCGGIAVGVEVRVAVDVGEAKVVDVARGVGVLVVVTVGVAVGLRSQTTSRSPSTGESTEKLV